jgi:hypothetical protein
MSLDYPVMEPADSDEDGPLGIDDGDREGAAPDNDKEPMPKPPPARPTAN